MTCDHGPGGSGPTDDDPAADDGDRTLDDVERSFIVRMVALRMRVDVGRGAGSGGAGLKT